MEFVLRLIQFIIKLLHIAISSILNTFLPKKTTPPLPPIRDKLLTLPLVEIIKKIRLRRLTSTKLVTLYIERIKDVNPLINAMVEDRFELALTDAKRADDMISKCPNKELTNLFSQYPILGIPFTVKEACGFKGMSFCVGSLQRAGMKAQQTNSAVENLQSAGGIPLLVSANPEYCFCIETTSYTNGRCLNPYDFRRTSGGSSGGEGALNGSGATLFGVATDIAGSIRIPCLFNGVFGHKPTGGLLSNTGSFPSCDQAECMQFLQSGPITRFASDLSLILHIMAGKNADKLNFTSPINTQSIKIFYSLGYSGVNGFLHHNVTGDIQFSILKAVKYLRESGLSTEYAIIKGFHNSTEVALSGIARLTELPLLLPKDASVARTSLELMKSFFKLSPYTKEGLIFELLRRSNAFMSKAKLVQYQAELEHLKRELIQMLGTNGVLFFPTFYTNAIHHHTSGLAQWAIDYSLIFNVLGLPATHVPMGVDNKGLPVGFQIVAAPFKDLLCLQIAGVLESGFGGWVPPVKHLFETN